MEIVLNIGTILFFFIFMECTAWFTHKYIMHGFLWSWHKSHHEPRNGVFELNDLFGIFFAIISAALIITGSANGFDLKFYAGIGILLYGIAYFLVHDVFVHQRISILKNTNSSYFKAMRFAHKVHHKVTQKNGAEAFGFLFVNKKYLDKYRSKNS
jgi:beta-carotene 3-hydroxylase